MPGISISKNLEQIKQNIKEVCQRCGRTPDEITLIAVSKTMPVEDILEAADSGQLHFGENRARELEQKMLEIDRDDIIWHMIGNLQTRQIKNIAGGVHVVHSVEQLKYMQEINRRAEQAGRVVDILIQVNISNEVQKGGCRPEEVGGLLSEASRLGNIRVIGLMGMAALTDNPEETRPQFKLLKQVLESHRSRNGGNIQLQHLSMGMSNDYEVAIEEGATMIRVGSAIFGSRNQA